MRVPIVLFFTATSSPNFMSFTAAFSLTRSTSTVVRFSRSSSAAATTKRRSKHRLFSSSSSDSSSKSTIAVETDSMKGPTVPPIPSTSKRLFLVRHGEVINPGGDRPVYYGAMDVPLSSLGELEAKAAGEFLSQFHFQHIAASPLSRAIFGANQVLSNQLPPSEDDSSSDCSPKELKIYPGFGELDRGAWCGKTKAEIGEELMARFDACDESVTPEGGESYPALKRRVLQARDELLAITDCGRASAVVSHLQVTRSMLSDALNIPTEKMAGFKVATASITCIDYDSNTGEQVVHFQSYKPEVGLEMSKDLAN